MDKESQAISKLELLLDKRTDITFDDDEIKILRRVVTLVRGLDALGTFANFVSRTVIWFGVVIGGMVALKTGFVGWVADSINGR